jgi:predicted nucleic acid-binding protein
LEEEFRMSFDPREFSKLLVTDTCAVWNLLSSDRLYKAAISAKLTFCITPMVLYECLYKPRNINTPKKAELKDRFLLETKKGQFPLQHCELDDLLAISKTAPVSLGSGELSCIAMAYKLKTIAVMTDERKARNYAENKLSLKVETTPKLYGWLHYHRHLIDGDHTDIISEHESFEKMPLTYFLNQAYEVALQYRAI